MVLPNELKVRVANVGKPRSGPLWKGPSDPGPMGGVTQSMIGRWLNCRERARIHYIEGLQPSKQFNHRIEYGQLWHACEEEFAKGNVFLDDGWSGALEKVLKDYAAKLVVKYPLQQDQVRHWYNVCKVQFPLYVVHWMRNPDVIARKPVEQEQVFDVLYRLPSGRDVRLRGKRDGVDVLGTGKDAGIFLCEHKTKGDIDEMKMQRQLTFDLQTLLYMTAMTVDGGGTELERVKESGVPIRGVRYNVVRRPLSGGKGSIVQHKGSPGRSCSTCSGTGLTEKRGKVCSKCGGIGALDGKPAETDETFYGRVAQYIKDEPGHYFMRWKVEITPVDIKRFRDTCLDPILENMCDWYDHVSGRLNPEELGHGVSPTNWRHPFGVYNALDEGGSSDVDEYLLSGSEIGLTRVNTLFEELT